MAKKTKPQSANRINLGAKPGDKSGAWAALSHDAKLALKAYRQAKRFGGTPNQAPYWAVQEYGEPLAQVEAVHYISQSLGEWRSNLMPGILARWIRG